MTVLIGGIAGAHDSTVSWVYWKLFKHINYLKITNTSTDSIVLTNKSSRLF